MEAAGEQFSVSQREQTKHLTVLENSQDIKVNACTHTDTHTYRGIMKDGLFFSVSFRLTDFLYQHVERICLSMRSSISHLVGSMD